MSVTVRIPTPMRQYTGQQAEIEVEGRTVGEVLDGFKSRFPEAASRFFANSRTARFVNLYLNDEDIRFMQDLGTPVKETDTVSIILAIAGGVTVWPSTMG
jgi:molybdopterin converting factor small subunit